VRCLLSIAAVGKNVSVRFELCFALFCLLPAIRNVLNYLIILDCTSNAIVLVIQRIQLIRCLHRFVGASGINLK
jgi:hypothetical protein